jgi:hypothetical protein
MKIKRNQRVALSALFAAALLSGIFACENDTSSAPPPPYVAPSPYRVTFSASTATVMLSALVNQDVYLVKVNKSSVDVIAANTGSVASSSQASASQGQLDDAPPPPTTALERPLMDSPQALAWKPSAALWEAERARDSLNAAALSVSGPLRAFTPAAVGDAKLFWVNDSYVGGYKVWVSLPATLRAQGTHCNVWVADVDYNDASATGNDDGTINSAQAGVLRDKFDIVYPLETNLLGYEFGGGLPSSSPYYGGRDGDPRVQILVYKNSLTGLGGYFWQKDYFSQSALGATLKTNYAEIFYLNSVHLDKPDPSFMYSTLAHEFQHMINFNMKGVRQGLNSDTWYDEMLSMLTEDVLDPFIGIPSTVAGHPIQQRMPSFLATYNEYALDYWPQPNSSAAVYPKNYAFGAYLVRNYGGPLLLQKMLANNSVGIASISAALAEITPGMDFQHALDRYGEALVYSGTASDVISFNHAVTQSVNGKTYTFYGFDIWNMTRNPGPDKGPKSYSPSDGVNGYSVYLQRIATNWSGDFSVTLKKPASPYIDLYVMTRAATP